MFATFRQLFQPKNKDLRNRVLFTLVVLLVFEIGTLIPIPGTSGITRDLGFLELLNVMGGGALKNFSILALGVSPYISASIIVQLLQMDIIPYFSELGKQGNVGRQKLNQITRYIGIALAFIQGYFFAIAFMQNVDPIRYLQVALILTAGTAFLLWIGDKISQKGVGNGSSMIIMAGILATIPNLFISTFGEIVSTTTTASTIWGILLYALFVLVYLLILVGVIFVQQAERRVPIQYSNRTTTAYGSQQTYMPFKLNSAGVMPVIFASMVTAIPTTIASFIKNDGVVDFINTYLTFNTTIGFIIYMFLIVFFAYFSTYMQLKPEEMAKDLQQRGGYVPGVRPGNETTNHFKDVLSRLTFVGAIFLIIIAGLPILFSNLTGLSAAAKIGGTGLLIVVGVALEVYNQIENSLLTRSYTGKK